MNLDALKAIRTSLLESAAPKTETAVLRYRAALALLNAEIKRREKEDERIA